jgi:hypothetical protein
MAQGVGIGESLWIYTSYSSFGQFTNPVISNFNGIP